ncbi:hypothetical protein DER45DRAFT_534017 [Fusarium avenaceum]|nr:hypothetical protein DER45DRAFT_534017 [Fusarium avenaceum]
MHANILLAFGLFANSALAGPCKPRSSRISTASDGFPMTTASAAAEFTPTILDTFTEVSSQTVLETTKTTTMITETTTAISDSSKTTTVVDLTITPTAESTAKVDSTTLSETITTTTEGTTTVESTTTAAAANPTFSLLAVGGPVDGEGLQGYGATSLLFNPSPDPFGGPSGYKVIPWIIEPSTGRLMDPEDGFYACSYNPSFDPNSGAPVALCREGDGYGVGLNKEYSYLACQIVKSQFSCSAPATICTVKNGQYDCVTSSETGLNEFYVQNGVTEDNFLFINTGNPSEVTPIGFAVHYV